MLMREDRSSGTMAEANEYDKTMGSVTTIATLFIVQGIRSCGCLLRQLSALRIVMVLTVPTLGTR